MRVLIFGCSFSQGSYTSSGPPPKEKTDYNIGWWSYMPCIQNATKDIFSVGGGSYNHYVLLYKHYIENKDYDFCIIQETSEPRAGIPNYKEIISLIKKHQPNGLTNNNVIYSNHSSLLSVHPPANDTILKKYGFAEEPKSWLLEWYNSREWHWLQYKMSKKWLVAELLKDNIPVYFFHMMSNNNVHYGGIDLGLDNLYYKVDNNYSFPLHKDSTQPYEKNDIRYYQPHLTEEGNKIIGSIVDTELKKYI